MNNIVIAKKLESLTHCLTRIEEKRPAELSVLSTDFDTQDILSVNLERAIQLCVDIAAILISEKRLKTANTMAGCFKSLKNGGILSGPLTERLQKAVGFRNISVHEYADIDWQLVFDSIHHHLDTFKEFMRVVISAGKERE